MLEIMNLDVSIRQKKILFQTSLTLQEHALTVLIGKNGCGKSTMISCIGGMRPYNGSILLDGQAIQAYSSRERARRIAILPQMLQSPHITVESLIQLGRTPHLSIGQRLGNEDIDAVENALAATEMEPFRAHFLDNLSGGERQKAYLTMILAQNAPTLILDEPTTYMDVAVAHKFMTLLRSVAEKQKKTVLTVMHDLNLALRFADRVAIMNEGRIVFHDTVKHCLATDIIERTFGVMRYDINGKCFFEGY